MEYGYARISTPKQSIERQVRNILRSCPTATIFEEVYTGRYFQGRKEWEKLMKKVVTGDRITFDSVSRMSRDAEEGFELYQQLYERGIDLVFLKEPHINTEVYKKALTTQIAMTGTLADYILEGVNNYLMALAKEQIRLAFEQSEKEVVDLRQRTKEGMETAKREGKQIGRATGDKLVTKKSIQAKKDIVRLAKDFGGNLKDVDCIRLIGIRPNTYYKYKREIIEEMSRNDGDEIQG